jgi:WD40 repeat protein
VGKEISKSEFGSVVNSVSYSADGRYFAAGSGDKTARVIEVATGREINKTEFGNAVNSVNFSPDGRYLAAGSWDNTARVIEVGTGREIRKTEFESAVNSVSFSPDGRYLASGSEDGTVRVIEYATDKEISYTKFSIPVTSVSYSPDGLSLVVQCHKISPDRRSTRVIEAATGKEIRRTGFSLFMNRGGSLSPDGRYFAELGMDFNGENTSVRLIEIATGRAIRSTNFGNVVNSLSFSPDGRHLAVGNSDKTARVIEVATWKEISKLVFGAPVTSVSFGPNCSYLAVVSNDHTARLIDMNWIRSEDGSASWIWPYALGVQSGAVFEANGQLQHIWIWRLRTDHDNIKAYTAAPHPDGEHWQHAILKWSLMPPETRTTSPWTDEPVRVAAGRWFMQSQNGTLISDTASVAPCPKDTLDPLHRGSPLASPCRHVPQALACPQKPQHVRVTGEQLLLRH